MRSIGTRLVVLLLLFVLISQPAELYGYGTTTHSWLSAGAYGAALNILGNFFQALALDEQRPLTVSSATSNETYTAVGWLVQGSIREDDEKLTGLPPVLQTLQNRVKSFRPMFHFLDPVNNIGLSGFVLPVLSLKGTTKSSDWAMTGVGITNLCTPLSSSCFPIAQTNDFSYFGSSPLTGARTHYLNGLTCEGLVGSSCSSSQRDQEFGLMFRSLGQVIHLVQDAAQPQHVRDDPHTEGYFGNPSVYENYVDAIWANQLTLGNYAPPSFGLPNFFFANGSGQGLAEFANSNFVSAGTNCTSAQLAPLPCNTAGAFQYTSPKINSISAPFTLVNAVYGGNTTQCQNDLGQLLGQFLNLCSTDFVSYFAQNQIQDLVAPNTSRLNPYMSTYSIFASDLQSLGYNPIFSLNRFNYAQQASLLLPRAVGYSAGLLNYFFRGSMAVQGDSSGFTITNTTMNGATPEDMNGTFTLYYDDQGGNRQIAPGSGGSPWATWSLSIPGGMTSSSLSFTPPTSPAPGNAGQYTLVFHGTLGDETDAVAGTQVQLGGGFKLNVVMDVLDYQAYPTCLTTPLGCVSPGLFPAGTVLSPDAKIQCDEPGFGYTDLGPPGIVPMNKSCTATYSNNQIVSLTLVPQVYPMGQPFPSAIGSSSGSLGEPCYPPAPGAHYIVWTASDPVTGTVIDSGFDTLSVGVLMDRDKTVTITNGTCGL